MRATLPAAVLLAACSAEPAPQPPGRLVTSLSEVGGNWDIASFEGYTPVRLHGGSRRAFVNIGKDGLSYSIECNYSGNPARIDDKGVLQDLTEPPGSRAMTMALCGGEIDRREDRLFSFFASRPTVRWGPGGSLRMTTDTSELVLERPEQRRLANLPPISQLSGRWVPMAVTEAENDSRVGYSGYGFQQPSLAVITPRSLAFSGCGGVRFTFQLTNDGRLVDVRQSGQEADCGSDSAGRALVKVMTGDPRIERDSSGLALSSGRLTVTMESEAEVVRRNARALTPPVKPGEPGQAASHPPVPVAPPPARR